MRRAYYLGFKSKEFYTFTARVCRKVMFSYCLCVCLSFWTITFECLDIETSFLVWWYILTISRSNLSIKVIESRSKLLWSDRFFGLLDTKFLCFDQLMVLVLSFKSRSFQGQGHLKITVILELIGNVFCFLYRSGWLMLWVFVIVSCLFMDRKNKYPSCSLSFILYFLVQSLAKACLSFVSYNTSEYNLT